MGTPLNREQLENMIKMVINGRHPLPDVMMPLVARTWEDIQESRAKRESWHLSDEMLGRVVSTLLWWEDKERRR